MNGKHTTLVDNVRKTGELAEQILALQAASKTGGSAVKFGDTVVTSEEDLKKYVTECGVTGLSELAGIVDAASLACHEFDNDMKESDSNPAYKNFILKQQYGHVEWKSAKSHQEKYMPLYTGNKPVKFGQVIYAVGSENFWKGSDGLDGFSTDTMNALKSAKENLGTYVEDAFTSEVMIAQAKALALKSFEFHASLHKHIDDVTLKLHQRGMPDKSIRVLISNQLQLIMKALHSVRKFTYPVSAPKVTKLDRLARQWWNVLACHRKMAEFMEFGFEHHPIVAASFVRFLTDHLVSGTGGKKQDDGALKKLMKETTSSLEDQLRSLVNDVKQIRSKLDLIVKYHPELLKPKKN